MDQILRRSQNTFGVGRPGWHTQPPAQSVYDVQPFAGPGLEYATSQARAQQPLSRLAYERPTFDAYDCTPPPMDPRRRRRVPVPSDLKPFSLADLKPPQDPHNFILADPINDPPRQMEHCSPIYYRVDTPPDLSPHLDGDPFQRMLQPNTSCIQDDSAEVEAAIIRATGTTPAERNMFSLPYYLEQGPNPNYPNPTAEPNPPPPTNPPQTYPVTEPQELAQHLYPPPDEVGLSGSTVSGLPLPPLRSPPGVSENIVAPHAWSASASSFSALGLQPAPPTSLGDYDNPNVLPHVQPPYARLSEREAAAVEREAAALRASQSHGHTNQSNQPRQRNAWTNNQTLAQVGQPPHYPGQSLPPTSHSQPDINRPRTLTTSSNNMDPAATSLKPAVFSSPSPESDRAAPPPPPSTTTSNLTSRNPSRQVTGDSSSTEVPIAIDPIAGCKRTAEEAFAGDGAPDCSGSEEDVDMLDQLTEESEPGIGAEAEAGEGAHDNLPVFILENGQPPPKRRKLNNTNNTQNANRGLNIRLPPPPSLAGSSRPPAAPTPGMMLSQLDIDPTAFRAHATTASAGAIDPTLASANLPPPVPMFQRDPDAPPSYADWVRDNQPDAEVERWMECTRRNLAYDPSVVPAPPEGFESGKDRKKEGEGGEGTSGEKEVEIEGEGEVEGEREASLEGEEGKEKEGNMKEDTGGSGKSKPYEINENTPPNINEGLWCLFDYPKTTKPKYSYAFMARVAILGSPTRRLQLQDIYVMIEAKFPFYRDGNHVSWKNSIRHNLSTNKWFVKCERDMVHEPGYSAMWTVDTTSKGGPKKKRERLGRSKKGRAVLAAREAAEKGIVPDPRIVALAIAMKTAPPSVPPGVPIVGSAIPPPKLPPVQLDHTEKPPMKKGMPTPVPIAPAPPPAAAPSSPPVTTAVPSSSSNRIPIVPSAPDASGGAKERDTLMETDSVERAEGPGDEVYSLPPPAHIPIPIPTSPLATIEIESAGSAEPEPVPPKRGRVKGRFPPKKGKTLDPPLTTTPHASTVTATPRRSITPPKVPTPPFVTRRLSPLAPRVSNPAPQSQSQKSKTPPVFPLLNVFTQAAGPQAAPSQSQPQVPVSTIPSPNQPPPPATQLETPVQISTPRPSISAPSNAEEKDKGGRKGFDPQLLQRLVEEKGDPRKAELDKPVINRLFAVPATSSVAPPSTQPPTPALLKPGTPFGSASVGTRFGMFGLTKVASFGASGFGVGANAASRLTSASATGKLGGFGSGSGSGSGARAGTGAGFATFGTVANGSGTSVSKFGFTPAAFSNQSSTSPIKTSNVRGEGDDENEQDQDSDTDMGDEFGIDMSADVEKEMDIRTMETTGEPTVFAVIPSQAQSQTQTQGSSPSAPQSSCQHPQLNDTLINDLPTQPAPSPPTASFAPTQSTVTPPSPPASPVQGTMTNILHPTSLFHLDAKPKRRDSPPASSSGASSQPGPTKLIEQTIRKYVTLDPVTFVPTAVDLEQMVGELQTMRLVVHHNFLPRAPPMNEDYRRALENILKRRKRKRGEPRKVYRGAGDDDLGSVTESDDSGTESKL